MSDLIEVRVTRTFNGHAAGDVLAVENTKEIKGLIKSGLFVKLTKDPPPAAKTDAKAKTTKKAAADV